MKSSLKKAILKVSSLFKKTSDDTEMYHYINFLYEYFLRRSPMQHEVSRWLDLRFNYQQILHSFVNSEEYRTIQGLKESIFFSNTVVVGEDQSIDSNRVISWYKNIAEELNQQKPQKSLRTFRTRNEGNDCSTPILTILTSMYKGEKYITSFLENMINQTVFKECQLFIIDANSPQNEYEIIREYLEAYPSNIKYVRLKSTIGIYEAWNLAITESASEFLTNANVDDLHRNDALELKVQCLRDNPMVDVVYSDVYYSFIPNLTFEVVEKGGIKTNLPTANKFNLLNFNSPHNSPMWRRSLHDRVGYFDPTYKSAGDHEFWLRSAFSGATFMKIKDPVVVYYQNPDGMSTQQDSPGNIEGPETVKRYRSLLNL